MAIFHGKRGAGSFTGLTFEMLSWTVSATADVAEASVMDASAVAAATHWKEYLPGFKDWTATAECALPLAGIGLTVLGTEAELTFDCTDTGGRLYKGNAVCTGVSMVSSAADVARATLAFQGTDQLEENAT